MRTKFALLVLATLVGAGGCASRGEPAAGAAATPTPVAKPGDPAVRKVKSRDGRFEGELVGTPAPGSKFSRLQIGMEMNEVLALVGGPDSINSHETGKRWIPFYFGSDARRVQVYYKGEGCLTYTGGNAWGGGGNELIRITATSRADCLN